MKLRDGFVIGGRYQVDGLIANGRRVRVYSATSAPDGPGPVVVRVARHADDASVAAVVAARRALVNEWQALRYLHDTTTSAVPLPIELVRMYPGDPGVRRVMLTDRAAIGDEPYLIVQRVAGDRLSEIVRQGRLDEDRALALALRAVLLVGAAARVGLAFSGIDATDLIVDAAGENVSLVDVSRVGPDPRAGARVGERADVDLSGVPVPAGFGRMLVGLLSGATAPDWPADASSRGRWDELLATRRVPVELRSLALGALGYADALDASVQRVEDRLRALTRARRPMVYDHPPRERDLESPVVAGDVLGGRFEVTGELAQGARGFIVIARDRLGQGEVLLKLNKYVYDSAGDFALELPTRRLELAHEFDIMRRFAATTSLLPQPVARVHDTGRGPWFDLAPSLAPGEPVIAMRRLRGRPLLDLLPRPLEGVRGASVRGNRLAPAFVMRVVTRVAGLLGALHDAGYLFQDLKPENIVYDPASENVYLVDLASVCPRGADGLLRRDHVAFGVQTHGFAAPEFADLWERCDHRFDLYSLGATAYHLLTGVNPERVALERGQEYPTLPPEALHGLPGPVVDVVQRCLAPVDDRFTDARAVARAADAARLWMSRSRPLDVRGPRATFDDAGVRLTWTLPADPRLDQLVVERHRGGEVARIYEGVPVDEVRDAVATDASSSTTYVVYTALRRGADVLRSRGEEVQVDAHPAPIAFVVAPWFGGNRLDLRVPPHADSVRVVARTDRPPTAPDDGDPVESAGPGRFEHPAPPATRVFYAAFAVYGASSSAPRFGDAAPLPPLDDPGEVRITQDEGGVRVAWDRPVTGARVVIDDDGPGVAPALGERAVQLTGIERGATVQLALRVERMGVVSDPIFEAPLVRWPEAPTVRHAEGPGRVVIRVPAPQGAVTHHAVLDASGEVQAETTATEVTVACAGGQPARLAIRAVVEPDGRGPETRILCVPPPGEVAPSLTLERDRLPVRLRVGLGAGAASWTGRWSLRITTDDGRDVLTFDDALAAATDATGIPTWRAEDDAAPPGSTVRWTARLLAPDGHKMASPSVTCRVLEQLSPPVVEPVLAGVRLPRPDDASAPDRVDVRVIRRDETRVERDVSLPVTVELTADEPVEVAWRRAVAGTPMPWSEAVPVVTLRRPPCPVAGDAVRGRGGVAVSWTPGDDAPATWRVVASPDRRLVYEGPACAVIDVAPVPARGYEVRAVRHDLESPPLELTTRGDVDTARVAGPLTAAPTRPGRLGDARTRATVRVVDVRGRGVVEWFGEPGTHVVAVVAGPTPADAAARAAQLNEAGAAWPDADGVVGAMVVASRRALIPARIPRGHAVVVATTARVAGGPWRQVAACDAADPGVLVGVAATHAERLRLLPVGGALDPAARVRVVRADRSTREVALDELSPLRIAGTGRGAGVLQIGSALDDAVALALTGGDPAPIAVPLVAAEDPAGVWQRVWTDAARAALRYALTTAVARLGGVVARVSVANDARVDALIGGEHTILRASDVSVSRRGRLRALWSIQRGHGGTAAHRAVALDAPADVFEQLPGALVARWRRALERADGEVSAPGP